MNDLKLDPSQLSMFNGIINYVWILKPVYGFIADSTYFKGYWWKPSLILYSLLTSAGWAIMAFCVFNVWTAVLSKMLINIFLGFLNSVSEGIMVEMTKNQPQNI